MDMIPNKPYEPWKPPMKLQDNMVKPEKPKEMKMTSNIPKVYEKPEMDLIRLTDDKELVKKIQALTSLDVADIKKTDIKELLSLADIIEETVKQIRKHKMKMVENKPNDKKKKEMEMVRIEQPPYRQFMLKEF